METLSATPALSGRNPPVPNEFPSKGPIVLSFGASFDAVLNNLLCGGVISDLTRRDTYVTVY